MYKKRTRTRTNEFNENIGKQQQRRHTKNDILFRFNAGCCVWRGEVNQKGKMVL